MFAILGLCAFLGLAVVVSLGLVVVAFLGRAAFAFLGLAVFVSSWSGFAWLGLAAVAFLLLVSGRSFVLTFPLGFGCLPTRQGALGGVWSPEPIREPRWQSLPRSRVPPPFPRSSLLPTPTHREKYSR